MPVTEQNSFSALETNILKSKGLNDEQVQLLSEQGINCKADFLTVGDADTLASLTGFENQLASDIMAWATNKVTSPSTSNAPSTDTGDSKFVVESDDVVRCAHCNEKQPKDYNVGDLCIKCGQQAEPLKTCHWCHSQGPGKFCRGCGTEFVPVAELDLAVLLKRDGISKDEITAKLKAMDDTEKQRLWDRVRK